MLKFRQFNEAKTIAIGQCYPYAIKKARELSDEATIHHAIVRDPWEKKSYGHAWVEHRGKAYDWQSSHSAPRDAKEFRKLYRPSKETKYGKFDAFVHAIKHGHFGPWK